MPVREGILAGIDVFGQAFQTDEPAIAMRSWTTISAIKPRPPKPPPAKKAKAASAKKPAAKMPTSETPRHDGEG
jgi:hypothetical protein